MALACTLLLSTGFALQPSLRLAAQRAPAVQLCEPASTLRSYNAEEEKALRKTRLDFGGYPPGKYYTLEQEESSEAAYAAVRADHPVLSGWEDNEIKDVVNELETTPAELLIYSPIGPFLILSAISIWRDGMSVWGIPPCKDYVGFCQ